MQSFQKKENEFFFFFFVVKNKTLSSPSVRRVWKVAGRSWNKLCYVVSSHTIFAWWWMRRQSSNCIILASIYFFVFVAHFYGFLLLSFFPPFFCCHFYSVYGTEREGTNDPPDFFFLCRVLRSSSSSSRSYLLLTTPASVQSEWENGTDIRPTFFLSLSLLLELLFIICKRLVGWVGSRGRSGTAHQVRHQMSFSFPFYTTAGVRRKPPANWLFQRLCRVCCDCRLYLSAPYNNTNNNTVARASFFFLFFSFSFFFKQSFRKSRCGKSYRARENDYLLHLTRPYWKKTKKLFSCRDFFKKKRGERPKRETKKGQRLAAIFIFASFFLVYRLGAAVSLPWYIAAERDKSMGFMNPLTSYSLF